MYRGPQRITLIVLFEVYDNHLEHFRQAIGILQSEFCIFRVPGPGNQAIWIVHVILSLRVPNDKNIKFFFI